MFTVLVIQTDDGDIKLTVNDGLVLFDWHNTYKTTLTIKMNTWYYVSLSFSQDNSITIVLITMEDIQQYTVYDVRKTTTTTLSGFSFTASAYVSLDLDCARVWSTQHALDRVVEVSQTYCGGDSVDLSLLVAADMDDGAGPNVDLSTYEGGRLTGTLQGHITGTLTNYTWAPSTIPIPDIYIPDRLTETSVRSADSSVKQAVSDCLEVLNNPLITENCPDLSSGFTDHMLETCIRDHPRVGQLDATSVMLESIMFYCEGEMEVPECQFKGYLDFCIESVNEPDTILTWWVILIICFGTALVGGTCCFVIIFCYCKKKKKKNLHGRLHEDEYLQSSSRLGHRTEFTGRYARDETETSFNVLDSYFGVDSRPSPWPTDLDERTEPEALTQQHLVTKFKSKKSQDNQTTVFSDETGFNKYTGTTFGKFSGNPQQSGLLKLYNTDDGDHNESGHHRGLAEDEIVLASRPSTATKRPESASLSLAWSEGDTHHQAKHDLSHFTVNTDSTPVEMIHSEPPADYDVSPDYSDDEQGQSPTNQRQLQQIPKSFKPLHSVVVPVTDSGDRKAGKKKKKGRIDGSKSTEQSFENMAFQPSSEDTFDGPRGPLLLPTDSGPSIFPDAPKSVKKSKKDTQSPWLDDSNFAAMPETVDEGARKKLKSSKPKSKKKRLS